MKSVVIVLSTLLVLGVVAGTMAQTSPSGTQPPAASSAPPSTPSGDASTPSASAPSGAQGTSPSAMPGVQDRKGSADVDVRGSIERRDQDGAASPRTDSARETTRVFGLSPTAAAILGAAILVVVILALVSMTRGGSDRTHTDIDIDRRL